MEAAASAAMEPLRSTPPVLILDPGHGGMDGGAVTADGVRESALNLAIALKTRDLCFLLGTVPVLTRCSESLEYPDSAETVHEKKLWDQTQRIAAINAEENAVLLSIHQNTYPDPRPCGSEVLYARTAQSDRFAKTVHSNLVQQLCPENRRVAAPISDSIYLMRHINCPAVLVECGFLSNPTEARRLQDAEYQKMIAVVLTASCLQFIG